LNLNDEEIKFLIEEEKKLKNVENLYILQKENIKNKDAIIF
jgi:hypothetical protein